MSTHLQVLFLAVLAVGASSVRAATDLSCSPFVPHTRSVGNTVTDTGCTDDSIQSAIDAACPNSTVFITQERSYTAQHLTIQGKSLTLVGVTTSCGNIGSTRPEAVDAATAPVVTLDGTGNGGTSVLAISGTSNVTLQFLELAHGSGGSGSHGGGVNFNGSGSLTLDTSMIDRNSANFGGGIEMNGNGGSATLTLKSYSIIESNTASGNGGGINLEGQAQLLALSPFTLIAFNHAPNGKGGGLAIVGPAVAVISSPGYAALPVIGGNDAANGGGISVEGGGNDGQDAHLNLVNGDAFNPVSVSGNFASHQGGGIYLLSHPGSTPASAWGCLADFHLDGNQAPDGAALYGDFDSSFLTSDAGAIVVLNHPEVCADTLGSASMPCAAGVECSTISGNTAADAANHPTQGAIVRLQNDGLLRAERLILRHNSGGRGVHLTDPTAYTDTRGSTSILTCLIVDNDFSAETVTVDQATGLGTGTAIDACTIAHNAHTSGSVIGTAYDFTLTRSIIDQPGMSSLSTQGSPSLHASYVLAADPTGLPSDPSISGGEPTFVDAAAGNYHQSAFIAPSGAILPSFGIDIAPTDNSQTTDLDGKPRNVDIGLVGNQAGVRDLGPYEAQPILDRIFADAFGDLISIVQ